LKHVVAISLAAGEALSAECMRIATTTAPPDALKASAINTERAVTMNVKTRGEALLQPTRNNGTARHKATLHPAAQFIFGIPVGKIMPTLDVLNDEGPRLILVRDVLRRLR
jgi:hypothetical protein